jgi:hypothetical protein
MNRTRELIGAALLTLLFAQVAQATTVSYQATQVGGSTWEYDYAVTNDSLGANIGEFTVFFTPGQYQSLQVQSSPGNWDPLAIQPDPGLPDNGFFDAAALDAGLAPGATASGFAVRFQWLGSGTPGSQPFDIVDPNNFAVPLESGNTVAAVPLPSSAPLIFSALVSFGFALRRRGLA